jgi:flotillin
MDLILGIGAIVAGLIGLLAIVVALDKIKEVYTIPKPGTADYVSTPNGTFVACSDEALSTNGTRWYLNFPSKVPMIGRSVRSLDISVQEINITQDTIEANQAEFNVTSSTKYKINDVQVAALAIPLPQPGQEEYEELEKQLTEVIMSAVRTVTAKYNIEDARTKKGEIAEKVEAEIKDDFAKYGLVLVSFQLVDFTDTPNATVIRDISRIREAEIKSNADISVANKEQEAREAIAASNEAAEKAETAAKQRVDQQKEASKQEVEVSRIETVTKEKEVEELEKKRDAEILQTTEEIDANKKKAIAIIRANEEKEVAELEKQKRALAAEANRIEKEEEAIGAAATFKAELEAKAQGMDAETAAKAKQIREIQTATAEGITKIGEAEARKVKALVEALEGITDTQLRAMMAEKIIDAQKEVGLATAEALKDADIRAILGGESGALDLGKLIASLEVSNPSFTGALLNKIARPNDLGLTDLELNKEEAIKHIFTKKEDVEEIIPETVEY